MRGYNRILKVVFFCSLFFISTLQADVNPRVELKTTLGVIEIELLADKAPITVENFLNYVNSGFYNNMIFHRAVYGWLIQGGGYDKDYIEYETNPPIKNEADNGLKNVRGTIAMARFSEPDSADSQFFINLDDNHSLDHKAKTKRDYGYCVFGRVVKGIEVADAISEVEKHEVEGVGINVPIVPVIILQAKVIN